MTIYGLFAVIGLCLIVGAFVWYYINKKGFKQAILDAILLAEMQININGSEKMDFAIDRIIELLPNYAKWFITKALIKKLIQDAFDSVKKILDYNKGE